MKNLRNNPHPSEQIVHFSCRNCEGYIGKVLHLNLIIKPNTQIDPEALFRYWFKRASKYPFFRAVKSVEEYEEYLNNKLLLRKNWTEKDPADPSFIAYGVIGQLLESIEKFGCYSYQGWVIDNKISRACIETIEEFSKKAQMTTTTGQEIC